MITPNRDKNNPDFLYKYYSVQERRLSWLKDTLLKEKVYFSNPSQLNDPFEFHVKFSWDAPKSKVKDYWKKYVNSDNRNLNRKQRRELLESFVKDQRHAGFQEEMHRNAQIRYQEILKHIGIFCLSPYNDNMLMWSHYADSHKGVCLQFNRKHKFLKNSEQVIYTDDIPTVNFVLDNELTGSLKTYRTKGTKWNYEDERRVIDITGFGERKIPKDFITGIILGCNISDDDRTELISTNQAIKNPLSVYQAFKEEDKYQVSFKEVK